MRPTADPRACGERVGVRGSHISYPLSKLPPLTLTPPHKEGEGDTRGAHAIHDPGRRAVLARAARLAQRLLRRPPVARRQGRCRRPRRRHARRRRQGARRGRRRALARRGAADARAHAAGRGQAAAAPPVRRHGAAGLRPVRLPVRDLLQAAIADGKETKLNLCVPGGKDTSRMLKRLLEETPAAPASPRRRSRRPSRRPPSPARATPPSMPSSAWRRASTARARRRTRATSCSTSPAAGSATRRATASASIPRNDPALADAVRAALRVPPDFPVGGKPIRDALIEDYALGLAPDMLFELMSYLVGGERRQKAKALAKGEDPDGDAATLDVLAVLEKFAPGASRPGSVRGVPRAAAAAPLLHRLLPPHHAGPAASHRRRRALRALPAASGWASPPPSSPTG